MGTKIGIGRFILCRLVSTSSNGVHPLGNKASIQPDGLFLNAHTRAQPYRISVHQCHAEVHHILLWRRSDV